MTHSVHFRDPAGEARLEDVASLDAALERVERLRNEEGATDVRVFREVPIEVRTYYRVTAVDAAAAPAPAPEPPELTPAPEPEPDAVVPGTVIEPPSGAMVMSPPPAAPVTEGPTQEDLEVAAESHVAEGRRLFSRS
jgi:predicted component of type VI protein secretion system